METVDFTSRLALAGEESEGWRRGRQLVVPPAHLDWKKGKTSRVGRAPGKVSSAGII